MPLSLLERGRAPGAAEVEASRRRSARDGVVAATATVIPQTGSIARGGRRHGRAPATGTRSPRPAACSPRPDGHDLGEDRQRDLGGGAGADVEAGGRVDPVAPLVGRDVRARSQHARAALAAGDQPDVGHAGLQRARGAPCPRRCRARRRRPRIACRPARGARGSGHRARACSPSRRPSACDRGRDRRVADDERRAARAAPARGRSRASRRTGTGCARRRHRPAAGLEAEAVPSRPAVGADPQQQRPRPVSSASRACACTVGSRARAADEPARSCRRRARARSPGLRRSSAARRAPPWPRRTARPRRQLRGPGPSSPGDDRPSRRHRHSRPGRSGTRCPAWPATPGPA